MAMSRNRPQEHNATTAELTVPLIYGSRYGDITPPHDDDSIFQQRSENCNQYGEALKDEIRETPTTFVWILTSVAGLSGLLFGYDTGIISSTLLHLGASFPTEPTTLDKSLITSSTSLAALLASFLSGVLSDKYGRKKIIYLADLLFIVGALWQSFCFDAAQMVLGRFIVGLGVGLGSGVVPIYISELAPKCYRGRLLTMYTGCITFGQVVSYTVGWWISHHFAENIGWRWGVGLGALPAIIQAGGLLWQPESPRWLVMARRKGEAREVLVRVLGVKPDDAQVEEVLQGIVSDDIAGSDEVKDTRSGAVLWDKSKWQRLWASVEGRKALGLACLAQGLQQLCGFNSLMYFSATIFSLIGFTNPTAVSMIIATTNLLFTVVAFTLIDRIGRRRILLHTIPIMGLGLSLAALGFSHLPTLSTTTMEGQPLALWSFLILSSLTIYVAAYATGIGTIPWSQSELFPLHLRGLGSGIATAVNWTTNFLVGLTFLEMIMGMGPVVTFVLYAGVCLIGWVLIKRYWVEMGGVEMERAGGRLRGAEECLEAESHSLSVGFAVH